jgi:hypothetical protein
MRVDDREVRELLIKYQQLIENLQWPLAYVPHSELTYHYHIILMAKQKMYETRLPVTASMHAQAMVREGNHFEVSVDWMRGWNACLAEIDKLRHGRCE